MSIFSVGGGNAAADYEIDQSLRVDDGGWLRLIGVDCGLSMLVGVVWCWLLLAGLGRCLPVSAGVVGRMNRSEGARPSLARTLSVRARPIIRGMRPATSSVESKSE